MFNKPAGKTAFLIVLFSLAGLVQPLFFAPAEGFVAAASATPAQFFYQQSIEINLTNQAVGSVGEQTVEVTPATPAGKIVFAFSSFFPDLRVITLDFSQTRIIVSQSYDTRRIALPTPWLSHAGIWKQDPIATMPALPATATAIALPILVGLFGLFGRFKNKLDKTNRTYRPLAPLVLRC